MYPPENQVFNALKHTPWANVKVVILGQDPYHDKGQAHGLAFSVPPGVKKPPSLVNIFKELTADLKIPPPASGCLYPWADQGVLLLNTVLTVRAHKPQSHRNKGWETFTDAIISKINERSEPAIFVLWGAPAQKKHKLINQDRAPRHHGSRIPRRCRPTAAFSAAGPFPRSIARSHPGARRKSTGG